MARKAFAVNDTVREKVRHLAGVGVRQDDIARIIGCAPKTLRKRVSRRTRSRRRRGQCDGRRLSVRRREGGQRHGDDLLAEDASALAREERTGRTKPRDQRAEANSPVVLVLPDNSRDPELTQALRERTEKLLGTESQPARSRRNLS